MGGLAELWRRPVRWRTMDELRQVLGVLRNGDGEIDATPLPTLADLDNLVRAEADFARTEWV